MSGNFAEVACNMISCMFQIGGECARTNYLYGRSSSNLAAYWFILTISVCLLIGVFALVICALDGFSEPKDCNDSKNCPWYTIYDQKAKKENPTKYKLLASCATLGLATIVAFIVFLLFSSSNKTNNTGYSLFFDTS